MSDLPLAADVAPPKPLPTPEEAFDQLPTPDEAFREPRSFQRLAGEFWDSQFSKGGLGRALDLIGQGAKQGWGAQELGRLDTAAPGKQSFKEWAKGVGLWNDYEKGQASIIKEFNELAMRNIAVGADLLFTRAPGVALGALGGALQANEEQYGSKGAALSRELLGAAEAFPAGTHTPGFPRLLSTPSRGLMLLEEAASYDILPRPAEVAREAFAPSTERMEAPRVAEEAAPAPTAPAAPPAAPAFKDIDGAARAIAPEVMSKWDALATQRETYTRWIEELRATQAQQPRAVEIQRRITAIDAVEGLEERLTRRQLERLDRDRNELWEILHTDTPDIARVIKARQEVDTARRAIAYQVGDTYKQARDLFPPEEAAERLLVAAREPDTGKIFIGRPGEVHADLVPDTGRAEMGFTDTQGRFLTRDEALARLPAEEQQGLVVKDTLDAADYELNVIKPAEALKAAAPREIRTLAQRAPSIARETEQRLITAGRPAEEAKAAAALVQTYYEARAAKLGTSPLELYGREAPWIRSGVGSQRGRTILGRMRNTIQLFDRADASTFIHELGHNWLEDMKRDALEAPAVADDLGIVKEWLGVEGEDFTRTAHEKFARGFERYLMEGVAPSGALARVFAQFKQWLTQIYQTVARLKAPINDDIRGVYDRLLTKPDDAVISPIEFEAEPSVGAVHEAISRGVDAVQAEPLARRVMLDRERMAEILQEGIDRAKQESLNAERRRARGGPAGDRVVERGPTETGPVSGGARVVTPTESIRESRTPASGESEAFSDAIDRPLTDKHGNIRLENLVLPADVDRVVRDLAFEKEGLAEQSRTTISDADVTLMAQDLGMSPKNIKFDKIEAYTAPQVAALRQLFKEQAVRTRDAMAKAASGGDKELVSYGEERSRLLMLQEKVSSVTAEAGRALRAFRQLGQGIEDAGLLAEYFQRTTGKTPEELRHEARLGLEIYTEEELQRFIRQQATPTWSQMVNEAFISNVLSAVSTLGWNLAGNVTAVLKHLIEEPVAVAIDRAAGRGQMSAGEITDTYAGVLSGFVDGSRAAWEIIKNEHVLSEDIRPLEIYHPPAIPGRAGKFIRYNLRLMGAMDAIFKGIARAQENAVQARRYAREEGLTGDAFEARIQELKADPPEDMKARVDAFANYQTFVSPAGSHVRGFQQFMGDSIPARMLFTFVRTPINLFKYEIERSPLGLVSSEVLGRLRNPETRSMQESRLVIGFTAIGAAIALAMDGDNPWQATLTGNGPRDGADRQVWEKTGWRPTSLQIGHTYWPINNLLPGGFTMSVTADLVHAVRMGAHATDEEMSRIWTGLVVNLAKDFESILPLRGMVGAVQASIDPDQYGQNWVEQTVAPVVPAAVAQVATWIDPLQRDVRGMVDAIAARVPGWREGRLQPSFDMWGMPIIRSERGVATDDPVAQALAQARIGIGRPQRKWEKERVELTQEQYAKYSEVSGQLARKFIEQSVASPMWARLPDTNKRELIQDNLRVAREMARGAINMQYLNSPDSPIKRAIELRKEMMVRPSR